MLPSMRFYIISIVSIFAALGIGIFIGFTLNTQSFIIEQNDTITQVFESQFEVIMDENKSLKANEKLLEQENSNKDEYIESSYNFIINNRLNGLNVGIIETTDDYITSSIGRDLELAGAKVINVTTINSSMTNKEGLSKLYEELNMEIPLDIVENSVSSITKSILTGIHDPFLEELYKKGYIKTSGNYNESIDYLIICGGSFTESIRRINLVDKPIVEVAKEYNIPILGVEKSNVNFSYIPRYRDFDISTVDNIDMIIGKVSMILSMEGNPGNYGIKDTADDVTPNFRGIIQD
ncbi:copper transporter [Tissierella sp.]|uniref:copper transporter n=1 Tax=Tissierella sp. TaxID=41274 RepID=UPI0028555B28|nr:copper transporter [Tissierella sp.]MDR7856157.1 copper transporter [Tissierella sp.]